MIKSKKEAYGLLVLAFCGLIQFSPLPPIGSNFSGPVPPEPGRTTVFGSTDPPPAPILVFGKELPPLEDAFICEYFICKDNNKQNKEKIVQNPKEVSHEETGDIRQ